MYVCVFTDVYIVPYGSDNEVVLETCSIIFL